MRLSGNLLLDGVPGETEFIRLLLRLRVRHSGNLLLDGVPGEKEYIRLLLRFRVRLSGNRLLTVFLVKQNI